MSTSLNKLLNNALMESVMVEGDTTSDSVNQGSVGAAVKGVKDVVGAVKKKIEDVRLDQKDTDAEKERDKMKAASSHAVDQTPLISKIKDFDVQNPDAKKYAGAGLAALGAGLGAVALAKKLRAKKAAAKK
jgi:hypothetical protein